MSQTFQPAQARFLFDSVYLPGIKNEHRATRNVIEAIPLDKGDYRPDAICLSALDLAWHLIATELRFLEAVAAGEFDTNPRPPRPETVKNSADLSQWYAEEFSARLETLSKLSDDQLLKSIDFRGMFQLPAVKYVGFITSHSIHHRGQLSMYLRPMGAKVPAIYGESYDSAAAKAAKST